MNAVGKTRVPPASSLLIEVCLMSFPAYAKYSGGTGEPNDPYQIATAERLMLLSHILTKKICENRIIFFLVFVSFKQ